MGGKFWRGLCPFFVQGSWTPSSTTWPGPKPTSMPSAILMHPAVWPQRTWAENWGGGSVPFLGMGQLGSDLTQSLLGRGLSSHLATTDMGQKLARLCPFGGAVAGSPSNTMWPGPRPTCMPSFILIHPTIWPQYSFVNGRPKKPNLNLNVNS